jgi:predicted DNA-binding transcriptional regulator AlpA
MVAGRGGLNIAGSQYSNTDLAEVVASLEALDLAHAPPEALVPVLAACAATEARIAVRLATAAAELATPADVGPDRFLTVREAAARVGMTAQYIYEHQATLPFVVRVGSRAIRVSEHRLARYMANRTRTHL